jgi:CRISPR-associated protein (TIGR03984 family)
MTNPLKITPYHELSEMLSLQELAGAIAFVSSPSAWQVVRIGQEGRLMSHSGDAVDTTKVFAVEGFHPESRANFRWILTREGGKGAVIKVDDGQFAVIETKYYLWGKVEEKREEWARLYDARVGSIWIPAREDRVVDGSFVTLDRAEYVRPSRDGLAEVVEELIVGLSSITRTTDEN